MNPFEDFHNMIRWEGINNLLLSSGFQIYKENNNQIYYTRPGKPIADGVSGVLSKMSKIFVNFSSNSPIPPKSSSQGYNPFELFSIFKFSNDKEKCKNWIFQNFGSKNYKSNNNQFQKMNNIPKPTITLSDDLLFNQNKERMFRFALNTSAKNKEINWKTFTTQFCNHTETLDVLRYLILKGYAIAPFHLKENSKSLCNENFYCADFLMIDIDEGKRLQEFISSKYDYFLGIYTTFNHSEQNQRFRVLIEIPGVVFSAKDYKLLLEYFIKKFDSDRQCSNPSRAYFGNNKGNFYNLKTGEIVNSKNNYYKSCLVGGNDD